MNHTSDQWHIKGRELQLKNQTQAAKEAYLKALSMKPDRLDSRNNLAVLLRQQKQYEESAAILRGSQELVSNAWQACRTDQDRCVVATEWARLLNSKSLLVLEQQQYELCRALAVKQLLLDPTGCGTVNLGVSLEALGKHAAAARSHRLGLKRYGINVDHTTSLVGLAMQSPEQSSQFHKELCNLATALLQSQPLKTKNWELLLARLGENRNTWELAETPWKRLWKGQNCEQILVWDEQGFGDSLQCLRWVNLAASRVSELKLILRPSLVKLVRKRMSLPKNCSVETMVTTSPMLSKYLHHCPLMALPVALAGDKDDVQIPTQTQGTLFHRNKKPLRRRIGLVWQAGAKHSENAQRASNRRSLPASHMCRHALDWRQKWDVELISLQLGDKDPFVQTLVARDELLQLETEDDWESTASYVEQLQLVITVDTAMVHLAGNLGVPCLLLLNQVHDWRWGNGKHTPQWYLNQTILRCEAMDQWEELLNKADSVVEIMFKR